ncbi:MAG: SUMF1/EgtB/PvdO family nonheme iron enzyme [Gammaproteobacteria bacterium]|nr:SUMF1/EgtB/PvdO family nonheme iron enzyme [Gammaproteobacteria bacterium]
MRTFFFFILILLITQPVLAKEKRVALVIGNSKYTQVSTLKNPKNDAKSIAVQLKLNGFDVIQLLDADKRKMDSAIRKFTRQLNNKNTVGLFYFAGHGVQVNNRNYLVPLKSNIKNEADVDYNAVSVGWILSQMELAENDFNLVILDACRDNPFGGSFRSMKRGLAKTDNLPKGSMILYAASPGQQAEDGAGKNGLFTSKLLKAMTTPGLTVDEMINTTAREVYKSAKSGQLPYKEGIILNQFYFNSSPVKSNKTPPVQVASADPDMASKQENTFWNTVVSDDSKGMYEAYLNEYPDGHYSALAKLKLKKFMTKEKPKAEPKVVPTDSTLTIRSNLNGDKVTINGEDKGSTRLDLKLKPGIYEIEVSKDGYEQWEQRVTLVAGVDQTIYVKLKREAKPAPIVNNNNSSAYTPKPKPQIKPSSSSSPRSITESITGMELLKIPKGCFQMGSNNGDKDEKPVHRICLSKDFYLGKYEVTQGQWQAIMGSNPSRFKKGNNHPVEKVSWNDVQYFIRKLNSRTGEKYRLPTEAEWEYACRSGGKDEKYCGGDNLGSLGWYGENWEDGHYSVGSKSPNGLGLYDMSGNVWEWVQDYYGSYTSGSQTDPTGASSVSVRVFRGGSWNYIARFLRSAVRFRGVPGFSDSNLGFRLTRTN